MEGGWQVALREIIFSTKTNQVNRNELKIVSSEGLKFYEKNIPIDAVSRLGSRENHEHLLRAFKTDTGLPHFGYNYKKINAVLFLLF